MKKILSVIIAIALVMSVMLVSCKKETAGSLVNGAIAKTESHSASEVNVKMNIVMSMMGMEIEMPIDMKLQVTDAKSEKPTTYTAMTMSVFGEDVSSEAYAEGDWVYSITEGIGTKMSREDAEDLAESFGLNDTLTQFPSEVYEGVEIVKNDDGTKSVEFTLTPDQLGSFYEGLIMGLTETTGEEGAEVELSDANIKITVKDGNVSELAMSLDMIMSVMGIEATAKCNIIFEYTAFDDDVKIAPPEGYLEFPEF